MGIAAGKRIAAICLGLAFLFCTAGCAALVPQPAPPEPTQYGEPEEVSMKIASFSFSHSGMSMDDCYSYCVTQGPDGARLQAERFVFGEAKETDFAIDESVLDELEKIVQHNRLDKWDGFHKTNSMVLDGDGFSLSITLSNGREISASGSNAFPNGYSDAVSEICALFDDLIDEYGDLYPKTLVSDELDHLLLSLTKRGGREFFCAASKRADGTVRLDIRIKGYEDFYPEREYTFYGSCADFPFDEIQSIVRQYDVPSWNGWEKTAENYSECEWFQMEYSYESGEHISAMGTRYPNDYENVRSELLSVIGDFIECHNASFIPWQS